MRTWNLHIQIKYHNIFITKVHSCRVDLSELFSIFQAQSCSEAIVDEQFEKTNVV